MFNQPLVAIDIGSSAIKVVELSGIKQKKLLRVGLEILPPGTVMDGMIQNQDQVILILGELMKKLGIRTRGRRVALALGGSSVMIKKVAITGGEQGVAEQIPYEVEQHFQVEQGDIYFDHYQLPGDEGPDANVLLVGAKREMVEQYLSVVHAVGMRTGVVECGVFSVANMFEYNYGVHEGLTALVNIGASVTQVALVANGQYLFTRDVAIGGEEYSRRVMEQMSVDRDNAENLKIAVSQGDGNSSADLQKLLGEINEQLVSEVQVTIDFFFQSGDAAGHTGLSSLFLTGGGSRILGLDAALAASLQIPVQILNPFQRVEVNPRKFQMDYISMQGHLYGVAVGLAIRNSGDGG